MLIAVLHFAARHSDDGLLTPSSLLGIMEPLRFHHFDGRTTQLLDANGQEQGRLTYTGAFRTKAEVLTREGVYTIQRKGISGVCVLFNDHPVVKLHVRWSGPTELNDTARPERSLVLKQPSIWRNLHELLDEQGHVHARITSSYNWRTWRTEHSLSVQSDQEPPGAVMLLTAVYALDAKRRRHSAAAVG